MTAKDKTLRQIMNYQLRRSSVQAMMLVQQALAEIDLRRVTYAALSVVVDNPGIRQGHLADVLGIDRPNIVKIIDKLEEAGFLNREHNAKDRRVYELRATALGQQHAENGAELLVKIDAILLDGVSDSDLNMLNKTLTTIENNARESLKDGTKLP